MNHITRAAFAACLFTSASAYAQSSPIGLTQSHAGPHLAPSNQPNKDCPVKAEHSNGNGVSVCTGDNGSVSIGASASQGELEHFAKYPLGQSNKSVVRDVATHPIGGDHSVPHDIGNAVHHFISHIL